MKRSAAYLFALGAAVSCVLPSVELDPSLGAGATGATDATGATGATGNVSNGGSSHSPSGGKSGSSNGGGSAAQGATGAEGGDDSGGGGGVGGAPTTGGLGGVAGATTAGSAGASGDGGGGGGSTKSPPVKSGGCDQPTTVASGERTVTSNGQERSYRIDIPTDYDISKPYRLFYASHWIGSTDEAVVNEGFYYLKPKSIAADEPAIFIAPQALPGTPSGTWSTNSDVDHRLFEDILTFAQENLCIDETRVFAIGFSFGASMTYSLSRGQQSKLRAAVGIAPANYNMYLPPATQQPIAWMQTTGMSDATNPWVNGGSATQGAKYIAIEHATNNGCTVPADIPTWEAGGYLCYDFEGCDADYPTKVCTFNGGHLSAGSSASATGWITDEAWDFFMQF